MYLEEVELDEKEEWKDETDSGEGPNRFYMKSCDLVVMPRSISNGDSNDYYT
jgi:hypothetical protein